MRSLTSSPLTSSLAFYLSHALFLLLFNPLIFSTNLVISSLLSACPPRRHSFSFSRSRPLLLNSPFYSRFTISSSKLQYPTLALSIATNLIIKNTFLSFNTLSSLVDISSNHIQFYSGYIHRYPFPRRFLSRTTRPIHWNFSLVNAGRIHVFKNKNRIWRAHTVRVPATRVYISRKLSFFFFLWHCTPSPNVYVLSDKHKCEPSVVIQSLSDNNTSNLTAITLIFSGHFDPLYREGDSQSFFITGWTVLDIFTINRHIVLKHNGKDSKKKL